MISALARLIRHSFDSARRHPLHWCAGALPVVLALAALALALRMREQTSSTRPVERHLDVWQEKHEALLKEIRTARPMLMFVGDSITENWAYHGSAVWARYYARRQALNFAISGDRTEHLLWRLERAPLERLDPRVVVVLIGVNNLTGNTGGPPDRPEEVARGVAAVLDQLKTRMPRARLLLLGLFPVGWEPGPFRNRVADINRRLAPLAEARGAVFLDLGPAFLETDGTIGQNIMWDGLHLTAAGYERWAQAMEPTLSELLGE